MRVFSLALSIFMMVVAVATAVLGILYSWHWFWGFLPSGFLACVAAWDLFQKHHSILRNYPLLGHLRFIA